jgi:hypothetical protein
MKPILLLLAGTALTGLCGCGDGRDPAGAEANGHASAEGKAEEGKISLKGPGVDLTFEVPKGLRGGPKADRNNNIFYPESTIGGAAIVGGQGDGRKQAESEAEFRFSTPDPVDKVLAWYRDPARAKDLKVVSVTRQGADILVAGTQAGKVDSFKLRLSPRPGGGTDGRLTIHHRD